MEDTQLQKVAKTFNGAPFSTYDFVLAVQEIFPEEWNALVEQYGVGGKGAGKYYSAYSRIAQYLNKLTKHEKLYKLNYRESPEEWGSPVIRYWSTDYQEFEGNLFPDEIDEDETVSEGAKITVTVNRYERNREAREKCIEKFGVTCYVCGFNFEAVYGEIGAGFIHVHHIKPIGEIGTEYVLNPKKDLIPLCPNCHAMAHRKVPALSIDELKRLVKNET